MAAPQPIISTRFRALAALALSAFLLVARLHWVGPSKPLIWTWMYAGVIPAWGVIGINAAFYGSLILMGITFLGGPLPVAEKGWWVSLLGEVVLNPVGKLYPSLLSAVERARTVLIFASLLSALVLLVTRSSQRGLKDTPPSDK